MEMCDSKIMEQNELHVDRLPQKIFLHEKSWIFDGGYQENGNKSNIITSTFLFILNTL